MTISLSCLFVFLIFLLLMSGRSSVISLYCNNGETLRLLLLLTKTVCFFPLFSSFLLFSLFRQILSGLKNNKITYETMSLMLRQPVFLHSLYLFLLSIVFFSFSLRCFVSFCFLSFITFPLLFFPQTSCNTKDLYMIGTMKD